MVARSYNNANANGGVAYANANNDSSNTNANNGSRLANRIFRSAESALTKEMRQQHSVTSSYTAAPQPVEPHYTI